MEVTEATRLLDKDNGELTLTRANVEGHRWSIPSTGLGTSAGDEGHSLLSSPDRQGMPRQASMYDTTCTSIANFGGDSDVAVAPEPGKTTVYELLKDRMDMTQRARARDNEILLRINLIMLNIIICLSLAVAILQLEWNDRIKYFDDGIIPNNCAEKEQCLYDTWYSTAMKICVSLLTVVNELQFSELLRKRVHNRIEYERDKQIMQEKIKWKSRKITQSMLRRVRLLRSPLFRTVYERYRGRNLRIRMLVFLPHPVPLVGTAMDKGMCLFMFARLYWLCVVIRAYNPAYRRRDQATRQTATRKGIRPVFSVTTIMRMYFHEWPVKWILTFMSIGLFYSGYGIYLYEREVALKFTLMGSMFLSLECMLTGYPADAYENYMPTTWPGKYICIFSLCWGLFLFALLIDYVHSNMQLDEGEVKALNWVRSSQLWQSIRNESALLIQSEWRRYRFECDYEDVESDDEEYVHGIAVIEKKEDKHIRRLKELKRLRARLPDFMPTIGESQTSPPLSHNTPSVDNHLTISPSLSHNGINQVGVRNESDFESEYGSYHIKTTQPSETPLHDVTEEVEVVDSFVEDRDRNFSVENTSDDALPRQRVLSQSRSTREDSMEMPSDVLPSSKVSSSNRPARALDAELRKIIRKEIRAIMGEKMGEVIHTAVADAVAMAQAACIENMQMLLEQQQQQQHTETQSIPSGISSTHSTQETALDAYGSFNRRSVAVDRTSRTTSRRPGINTGTGSDYSEVRMDGVGYGTLGAGLTGYNNL